MSPRQKSKPKIRERRVGQKKPRRPDNINNKCPVLFGTLKKKKKEKEANCLKINYSLLKIEKEKVEIGGSEKSEHIELAAAAAAVN